MILSRTPHLPTRPIWFARLASGPRGSGITVRNQHIEVNSSHLPRIAQQSIWESVFPKSLREKTKEVFRPSQKAPINPARYFIWIYILIGSQAIRIIGVQNEFNTYMRKAELRIGKLREVVEKLQKGEAVDVEGVLGTGDEEQEREWEDALREIEAEERVWQENKQRRQQDLEKMEAEKEDASPVSESDAKAESIPDLPASLPRQPPTQPGFY